MTCKKACELMMEYVAGELDKATAEQIRSHIDACDECKKEYELALGMSEAIENAAFDAPAELHGRIMSAVRNEKKRQRRVRLIRTLTAIGASAAAFVIIVNVISDNISKQNADKSPNSESNVQDGIIMNSDNVFKPKGEITSETVELSAVTLELFVGEWKTSLADGRTVTMYINDDSSVVVCIRYRDGIETYYDGMLEFTNGGITLTQSDGNENCRAVIDAVIKSGRLYFDIVSGSTPWRTVT